MSVRRIVLAFVVGIACLPSMPCAASSITKVMRSEDQRLAQKVSITALHIYLGDLLKLLSARTGVAISMDERDAASGMHICVCLNKVALGDVLDTLWSLNSYQGATWHWGRSGRPGEYSYRFIRPLAAREISTRIRQTVQDAFEQQAMTLIEAAKLTPEERKRLKNKSDADSRMMSDDRVMAGVRIFAKALSPAMQLRVLRGQETYTLQVSQLSPEARTYIKSEWMSQTGGSGSLPAWIRFETEPFRQLIAPALFMEIDGMGGHGYVGGMPLDTKLRKDFMHGWILPGDATDDPRSAITVASSPDRSNQSRFDNLTPDVIRSLSRQERKQQSALREHIAERRIKQLAGGTALSIMVALPSQQDDLGDPTGQTVAQYLAKMQDIPMSMITKWRDGMLLIRHSTWFFEDESNVPLKILRQVQGILKKSDYLPFEDMASLADLLNDAQLRRMANDFPSLSVAIPIHGLLALYHRFPAMRSTTGLALNAEIVAMLKGTMGSQLQDGLSKASAIRMTESKISSNDLIKLSLLNESGTVLSELEFTYGFQPEKH